MIKNSPGFASVSKQGFNRYSSFTHWLSVICYSWLPLYTQELPTVILDTQKRFPLFGTKKKATGSFLNPRNTHKLLTSFSPSAVEVIFPSYTSKRTLASHSNAFNASPLNYCHYAPSTVVSAEATLFYLTAILVSYKLLFLSVQISLTTVSESKIGGITFYSCSIRQSYIVCRSTHWLWSQTAYSSMNLHHNWCRLQIRQLEPCCIRQCSSLWSS